MDMFVFYFLILNFFLSTEHLTLANFVSLAVDSVEVDSKLIFQYFRLEIFV